MDTSAAEADWEIEAGNFWRAKEILHRSLSIPAIMFNCLRGLESFCSK